VNWPKHPEAPDFELWPAVGTPQQKAGEHLEGQQNVQEREIGDLLKRVQLAARMCIQRMFIALKDAVKVEARLANGNLCKIVHSRKEVMILLRRYVVEDAEKGVQNEGKSNPGMAPDCIGHGAKETQAIGVMNGEASENQKKNGACLEPMPDPFVKRIRR